jgi:hypothetical protein
VNLARRNGNPKTMRNRYLVALLWCVAGTSSATGIRTFTLTETEALGRALYEQDRRATIAAEMIDENFDPQAEGVVSWVIEGDTEHTVVRFIKEGETGMEAVLDAEFEDILLPVFTRPTNVHLSPFQQAQVDARETVRPFLKNPCSRSFDSAILHDPSGDGLLIYALALPDNAGEMNIGGHHRFSMSADGKVMRQADALSTSCVKTKLTTLRESDGTRGIAVRANLSDTPLEIHVYLSLRHKIPLYVVTRDLKMWKVEAGHMKIVREKPGEVAASTTGLKN